MVTINPRLGAGRFQWNPGGWFGAELGSTVWLLGAALVLAPEHIEAGAVALLCFLLPNALGLLLYRRRNRIAPYPALQWLILVIGIVSTIFVVYLNRSGLAQEVDPRLGYGQWGFYLLPVLFGGLMVMFHWMERAAVQKRKGGKAA
jgi:hypothetical protein